jgi:hypothetical protein
MTRRRVVTWLTVFLIAGLPGAKPRLQAQTVVATARSAGKLADDLEYLLKAVVPAGENGLQGGLDALGQFKQGEMLKGFDRNRLFGVSATLPQNPGEPPLVVAAVPVTDFAQLLDSLKALGMTVDDNAVAPGFSHKITLPDGDRTVFALQSKRYALFSLVPTGADQIRNMNPASWRPKAGTESDLTLALQLSKLPGAIKDRFLNGLEASLAEHQDRRPDEPPAEYRSRMLTTRLGKEAIKSLVHEGDTIELALNVDRAKEEISLDLAVSALPGTALAASLNDFSSRRSRFSRMGAGAPLAAWINLPVPKALRDMLAEQLDLARKEAQSEAKTDADKALRGRLFDLLKPTLTAGEIDLGLALQGPIKSSSGQTSFTMIGGMNVQNGREAERFVREAVAQSPPPEDVKLTFDAAKGNEGTSIHQIKVPDAKLDPKMVKQLGNASLFFAFPGNSVLVAFGEEGLKSIQQAIASVAKPAAGAGEPAAVQTHLSSLSQLADQSQDAVRRASEETFQGASAGRDRLGLRFRSEGQVLRLQLAFDVPALKFLAVMGHNEQRRIQQLRQEREAEQRRKELEGK